MKKFSVLLLSLTMLFVFAPRVHAENKVDLYLFWGDGCPHCAKEEAFLTKLEQADGDLIVHKYEVWHNQANAELLQRVASDLNLKVSGVPFTIVGGQALSGYYDDETTGAKIKAIIDDCEVNGCADTAAPVLGGESGAGVCSTSSCQAETAAVQKNPLPDKINIPLLGELKIKNLSLPLITAIIGTTDGFNPCAMWVLLFLISLLIGVNDRKRLWLLGGSFIAASAIVYYMFLAAWLNLFLFLGFVLWIRITIGIVAIGSGGYHIYDFWKNRDGGCHVAGSGKRKKVFDRLSVLVTEKSAWIAISGIVLLAGAVNLVQLLCSAGLPAVYTQILSYSHLPAWEYYIYLILYIFFYILDELLVFLIAMTTLRMKAVGTKFARWFTVIGGVVMLIIGILLIFRPGWIMF